MQITKSTNRIRIESPKFYQPETFRKLENGCWIDENAPHLQLGHKQMQARLYHDDKQGYQIYDISEDGE